MGNPLCTKTCNGCKQDKPLDQYYKNKDGKYGVAPRCKPCVKAEVLEHHHKMMAINPKYSRDRTLYRKYKIRPDQYESMLAQGCAACGSKEGNFHIDHDHDCCPGLQTCGKCVRGLLCSGCNKAIGFAKESIEVLESLVDYLKRWG